MKMIKALTVNNLRDIGESERDGIYFFCVPDGDFDITNGLNNALADYLGTPEGIKRMLADSDFYEMPYKAEEFIPFLGDIPDSFFEKYGFVPVCGNCIGQHIDKDSVIFTEENAEEIRRLQETKKKEITNIYRKALSAIEGLTVSEEEDTLVLKTAHGTKMYLYCTGELFVCLREEPETAHDVGNCTPEELEALHDPDVFVATDIVKNTKKEIEECLRRR